MLWHHIGFDVGVSKNNVNKKIAERTTKDQYINAAHSTWPERKVG